MSDLASMAARMYPEQAMPEAAPAVNAETAPAASSGERGPEAPTEDWTSVDDLVGRELSAGEAMYAQAQSSLSTPDDYQGVLREGFDHFEQQSRTEGNEEDVLALREGRVEAARLMHELQVPRHDAAELTRSLRDWMTKPALSEDANWDNKVTTWGVLEKEWGKDTQARVQLAQRTAAEACKRLPWLADLLESGAGNDLKLIKHFAEIGLRQARKGSKVEGNRNG